MSLASLLPSHSTPSSHSAAMRRASRDDSVNKYSSNVCHRRSWIRLDESARRSHKQTAGSGEASDVCGNYSQRKVCRCGRVSVNFCFDIKNQLELQAATKLAFYTKPAGDKKRTIQRVTCWSRKCYTLPLINIAPFLLCPQRGTLVQKHLWSHWML